MGVDYSRVKYVRDYFLDMTYRKESGRSMFYEVSTEVLQEVEARLGELNGEAFQPTIEDLWKSIQELSKDPASSVTQGLLVQKASEFVERSAAVYEGLTSYQDNLNAQIKQQVDKINKYGKELLKLNDKIRAIEAGGVEKANDLRDARNQILDELSELASISYKEDIYGAVSVQVEGMDFVKGENCYEIALDVDEATGFYTPYWTQCADSYIKEDGTKGYVITNAKVFDLNREISTDLNTDIGGLKAMLLARGDHRADYTDLDVNICTKRKLEALGISEKQYTNNAQYYGKKYYDECIASSVLMNVQGEFDQLVHGIVTKINGILANAAGVQDASATPLSYVDETGAAATLTQGSYCEVEEGGYMRDKNGIPIQLFTKITTQGYKTVTGTDGKKYCIYNEETPSGQLDPAQQGTIYTCTNLQVNEQLMQEPSMLGFRLADGKEDEATAEALKAAFTEEVYTLNPNVKKTTAFIDYYTDLVSQVGNSGYVFNSIFINQEDTVESIESARQQVVGVSSDEELSNMIKFQNAYNASSRYINVISEMMEHIINTLGV